MNVVKKLKDIKETQDELKLIEDLTFTYQYQLVVGEIKETLNEKEKYEEMMGIMSEIGDVITGKHIDMCLLAMFFTTIDLLGQTGDDDDKSEKRANPPSNVEVQ